MAHRSAITVVDRPEMHLVGQSILTTLKEVFEQHTPKQLHAAVTARFGEVLNRLGTEEYLVEIYPQVEDFNDTTPFTTFIGVAVTNLDQIPEGLIGHTIPAGRYAKVTHFGLESELGETYGYLYGTGLREVGVEGKGYNFEQWDHRYKPESPENEIDIYLAVK